MKTPEEAAREAAYEAAMQIVHMLINKHAPRLPTVTDVAQVILKETDLVWLHAIRQRAEKIPGCTLRT